MGIPMTIMVVVRNVLIMGSITSTTAVMSDVFGVAARIDHLNLYI